MLSNAAALISVTNDSFSITLCNSVQFSHLSVGMYLGVSVLSVL
jgi:hypothetical protein